MKEKPILFSAEMVRAILEGRKTQTRRVMKPQPVFERGVYRWIPKPLDEKHTERYIDINVTDNWDLAREFCPYGMSPNCLWVREAFETGLRNLKSFKEGEGVWYCADGKVPFAVGPQWKKHPAIHMPRWASRIDLEIVGVRVERLQSISEEDAKAEGMQPSTVVEMKDGAPCYTEPYQFIWNKINGVGAWESNPWVWVVSFKRLTR